MIHHFSNYLIMKRDLLELWLLNCTIAAISLSDIQTIFSVGLMILTGVYTAWKFRKDYKKAKKEEAKNNE